MQAIQGTDRVGNLDLLQVPLDEEIVKILKNVVVSFGEFPTYNTGPQCPVPLIGLQRL